MSERLKRAKERNERRINRSRSMTLPSGVTPFRTLQAQLCAFDLTKFKGKPEGTLQTPFGTVNVEIDGNVQRKIKDQNGRPWSYVDICSELDNFIKQHIPRLDVAIPDTNPAIILIKTILEYLERPSIPGIQSIDQVKQPIINIHGLSSSQQHAAACLCGILMLAESHTSRVPTGGKWERAAMRGVLRTKKFDWVFGGNADSGSYIPSHSSGVSTWRASRQNGFVTGPAQAKSIVEGTKSAFEISESFQENVKLSRNLEEDLSKSSDEEIYKAKCKLCHKFYKLGTNRDILLCDSCREKEEGKKFLSLIENNQLEAAEQYCFLVKQNLTLAEHYYLLISKNQFDIAEIFIKLFKSYKDHSYSMNYYYLSLQNNPKILEMYLTLVKKNLKLTYQYFYEIMENCGLNKAEQYFNIIMKTENVKLGNFFYNICKKCVMEKKFPEAAEQFYQLILENKLSEAEEFYRQYFTD